MLIRTNKLFIEKLFPFAVKEFLVTVRNESIARPLILEAIVHKVFEIMRKLSKMSVSRLPVQ